MSYISKIVIAIISSSIICSYKKISSKNIRQIGVRNEMVTYFQANLQV